MRKNAKLILAAAAVLVIAAAYVLIGKPFAPKAEGQLRILVTDTDQSVIKDKTLPFYKDDTLPELVKKNFDKVLISADGMLMNIETLETPADWSKFISIYQNGEMAMEGIMTLPFKDGDCIEFRMTVFDASAYK